MKNTIRTLVKRTGYDIVPLRRNDGRHVRSYLENGRVPWSRGYLPYRNRIISDILSDEDMLAIFRDNRPLPAGYGPGLDERCVEYPWFFSRLKQTDRVVLDAGSALNHEFILDPYLQEPRSLTIMTLAPEATCFNHRSISYQYGDLRVMPFQDAWFDTVVCISTIEHIGLDNSIFTGEQPVAGIQEPDSWLQALSEIRRVLKPGGRLFLTIPYGQYQDWGLFQQFDRDMIGKVVAELAPGTIEMSIYAYDADGWHTSNLTSSQDCEYSAYAVSLWDDTRAQLPTEHDNAAAARAVACLMWQKEG